MSGLEAALNTLSATCVATESHAGAPKVVLDEDGAAWEEDVEFVFVSLEGGDPKQLAGEVVVEVCHTAIPTAAGCGSPCCDSPTTLRVPGQSQGLLTEAPTLRLGSETYRGTFDEDVGSTMIFDRGSLKRLTDAHLHETRDLTLAPNGSEEPLVCVTTKRLKLTPLMTGAHAIGQAGPHAHAHMASPGLPGSSCHTSQTAGSQQAPLRTNQAPGTVRETGY